MSSDAAPLPLFPLAGFVLFPCVEAPLHIFEPRYQQLMHDALAGTKRIGMVTVKPDHADETAGDPPVFPVGCEGEIRQYEELTDGRFNLLLVGTRRFRIVRESLPEGERLYRCAEVARLDDPLEPVDEVRVVALRQRVLGSIAALGRLVLPGNATLDPARFQRVDDTVLVNTLCHLLELPALEKQGLLEAPTVPQRYERLASILRFRLAETAAPAAGPGSRELH